jgi:hypothetical protein
MRRKVGPKESSVKRLLTDRRETKRTEEEWNETAETKSAAAAHVPEDASVEITFRELESGCMGMK